MTLPILFNKQFIDLIELLVCIPMNLQRVFSAN